MKILYVTRDLRDGDFVEHELTRLVPVAQLSVLPSADEIINRLHTLGQRDVVLVDQASLGHESLELVKKARAAGAAAHLLVLMGVADQNTPEQVVEAGADECVVKSAGYMERLVRILQRLAETQEKPAAQRTDDRMRLIVEQLPACVMMIAPDGTILALNWAGLSQIGAQRLDQVVGRNLPSLLAPNSREAFSVFLARVCAGQPSSLELEWNGFDGVTRRQLLKGVPFDREPGSTAATLGVISDLPPAPPAPNEQQANENLKAAQAKCAALERELAAQQSAEARVFENIRTLRGEWDSARQDLEKRVKEAEEQRAALAALLESTRAAASEESKERSRWEDTLQQLEARVAAAEGQCRTLQLALHAAETARAESAALLETERSAWQAGVVEFERRLRQSEEERGVVEQALASEGERLQAARSQLESSEKARTELESALEHARLAGQQQSTAIEQSAAHAREERNGWEVMCRQLQEKLEEAAGAREALESKISDLLEASQSFAPVQQRSADAEEELKASREREFGLSMLLESLQLEKTQWGSVQAELEERRILAEAERASLQQSLEAAAVVQSRLGEELKSETAKLAAERAEKEGAQQAHAQIRALADELARALEQAKEERAELLQSWNQERTRLSDQMASTRALLESERQESAQLRVERDHLRRQLLDTGKRYRELIRSRNESFRQTLNAGVARLQQIAESRLAMLAAQHREELERLQQLVREGNLREHDVNVLLADGEQADRKLASQA